MAASKTYTLTQFAQALGQSERMTLDASKPFHVAYVKAEPAAQKEMREEWVIAYVQGRLDVPASRAAKIVGMTREERTAKNEDWEKAVNAAGQKFTYHVVNHGKPGDREGSGRNEPQATRVSAVQKDAALEFIEVFDGEDKAAKISAAIKALKALKARLAK